LQPAVFFTIGVLLFSACLVCKALFTGFYIVNQDERAVKTVFGRAKRLKSADSFEIPGSLREDEKERYNFPALEVIQPGGPYFKWPWEKIHKVSIATNTANMAYDPEVPSANKNNTVLDAVTKDQLNIELTGQIRYRVSDRNIYAYLFGVKNPIAHVMGYFVAVLRERIANFTGPGRIRRIHGGSERCHPGDKVKVVLCIFIYTATQICHYVGWQRNAAFGHSNPACFNVIEHEVNKSAGQFLIPAGRGNRNEH